MKNFIEMELIVDPLYDLTDYGYNNYLDNYKVTAPFVEYNSTVADAPRVKFIELSSMPSSNFTNDTSTFAFPPLFDLSAIQFPEYQSTAISLLQLLPIISPNNPISSTIENNLNLNNTILINKKNRTLTIKGQTFKVSISKKGLEASSKSGDNLTPEGEFTLGDMEHKGGYKDPEFGWRPDAYGGKFYRLKGGIAEGRGFGIHGSDLYNDPEKYEIGKIGTHGCIALGKNDLESFEKIILQNGGPSKFKVKIIKGANGMKLDMDLLIKQNLKKYKGISIDLAAGREPITYEGKKYYLNGDGELIPANKILSKKKIHKRGGNIHKPFGHKNIADTNLPSTGYPDNKYPKNKIGKVRKHFDGGQVLDNIIEFTPIGDVRDIRDGISSGDYNRALLGGIGLAALALGAGVFQKGYKLYKAYKTLKNAKTLTPAAVNAYRELNRQAILRTAAAATAGGIDLSNDISSTISNNK